MLTKSKKRYIKPEMNIVKIDHLISVNMISADEGEPPGQPDDMFGVGSETEDQVKDLEKNSFDDNPFR